MAMLGGIFKIANGLGTVAFFGATTIFCKGGILFYE
jgi:hypothetical protein